MADSRFNRMTEGGAAEVGRRLLRSSVLLLMAMLAAAEFAPAVAQKADHAVSTSVSAKPGKGPIYLGRGVNIFSHSYDPIWTDRSKSPFTAETFVELRKAGFQTVRVPLLAFTHMDSQNRLKPAFLSSIDWIVDTATAAGLNVIVDFHEYRHCSTDAVACETKMTAFWEQIAPRYASKPDSVVFELLNEPMGQITPELWNRLLLKELALVRRTNPNRTVQICSPLGGTFDGLAPLVLPEEDQNLIVDVHFYKPYHFTHGFQNVVNETHDSKDAAILTWGSKGDYDRMNAEFDVVAAWGAAHRRPMYLGEFGVYVGTDERSRDLWTGAAARAAETRKMGWAYYELSSEFAIYDLKSKQWNQSLLHSLVP